MVARIGALIELSFWQLAVRVLSGVRPVRHGLSKTKTAIEALPAVRFLPNGWVLAASGWVLGLALGISLAIIWF